MGYYPNIGETVIVGGVTGRVIYSLLAGSENIFAIKVAGSVPLVFALAEDIAPEISE